MLKSKKENVIIVIFYLTSFFYAYFQHAVNECIHQQFASTYDGKANLWKNFEPF